MADPNPLKEGRRESIPRLIDASADELLSGMINGTFTSVDIVNAYVLRINNVNPALKAVMEVNPDAWTIARDLDLERAQGALRGPLHGLPVLLKGNIGTRDDCQTNAGSYALQNAVVTEDSTVAAKLRAQGLVLLGKAALTEWSMFRSKNSSRSWNAITGTTYGAYHPKQCPGGSSGGSAVAADLGLAWATIGTETAGSIISPAERNNVVGIKPTVGLTSRHCVVPVSEHQDTVGPLARTVKDAARLLQVIVGPDPHDKYTAESPFRHGIPDYVAACKVSGFKGKRIGIARNVMDECSDKITHVRPAFEEAVRLIAQEAIIVEGSDFLAFADWKSRAYNPVTRVDFATNLPQYLSRLQYNPQNIRNVEDLRQFTRNCPEEEYPARNTSNWDVAIELGLKNTDPGFAPLYQENLHLGDEGGVLGALKRHSLDAIILPSLVAFEIPALVGSPIVTVPLGATPEDTEPQLDTVADGVDIGPGIPVGISFLGPKWAEESLIEMAYALEQKTLVRKTLKRHVEPTNDLCDVVGK